MNFIICISREDINPTEIIKKYKIILLLTVNFLIITEVFSQTPVDYFNSAKTSFEKGDIDNCMRHLNNCQNILGGSNAKIESLRFQAYYQKGNFLEAAKSFNNYDLFLSQELKSSTGYNELKILYQSVLDELNKEKKEEEERKKREIESDLAQTNNKIKATEEQLKSRQASIEEKNAKELASVALSNKDSSLLAFYNNHYKSAGFSNKTVELELDKKVNPVKYQRLADIDRLTKNVYYHYDQGMKSYKNYNDFAIADSLASHLLTYYSEKEFEAASRKKLKDLSPELPLRYNWNKEYYQKKDLITEYDKLVSDADIASEDYVEIDHEDAKFYMLLGVGLTGGAIIGNILYPGVSVYLPILMYGGGAGLFLVGGGMWLVHKITYKSAMRKYRRIMRKANKLKEQIGPVLEKRLEKLNGNPLIII